MQKKILIILILVAVTAGVYAQTARFDFVNFDDNDYIINNPHVRTGLTTENAAWAFTSTERVNWHPLTWLSLQADASLFGMKNPGGFHVTNVILHILSTVLLFLALKRMTSAVWPSAAVAALFALHPLHVESVAWVTERKDTLSTVFWMLTLLAYAWYVERPGWKRYLWVTVALALGLMAKPMLVTLPLVLLLLDWWPLGRMRPVTEPTLDAAGEGSAVPGAGPDAIHPPPPDPNQKSLGRLVIEKAPWLVLALVSSLVTFMAQQHIMSDALPLDVRLQNAALSYLEYLSKTIWPTGLVVHYAYQPTIPMWQWFTAVLVLAAITGAVLMQGRRRGYLTVGWLWFLGTLVPVIGLVQVGTQAMADRYTYVPLIGIFIVVAWSLADVVAARPRTRLAVTSLGAAALGALAAVTVVQVGYWKDSITLFRHAVNVNEKNAIAQVTLGQALIHAGDKDEGFEHLKKAVEVQSGFARGHYLLGVAYKDREEFLKAANELKMALDLDPQYADAYNVLGIILVHEGKPDQALEAFERALTLNPNLADTYANESSILVRNGDLKKARAFSDRAIALDPSNALALIVRAMVLAKEGRHEEAIEACRRAIAAKPDSAQARAVMADQWQALGRVPEAEAALREAVQIEPDHPDWHTRLGNVLVRERRWVEALAEFRAAVDLKSNDPVPYNTAAWILATHPDRNLRDGKQAVVLALKAAAITQDKNGDILDTLAAAYAEAGDFTKAQIAAQKAVDLATEVKATARASEIRARLALYRAGKPYHESAARAGTP
jgi:protein O-mannosyl-transferase